MVSQISYNDELLVTMAGQVNITLTSPQYYIEATTKLQNSLLVENGLKTSEAEVLCN